MNKHEENIRNAKTINELCDALTAYCNDEDLNTFLMGMARFAEAQKKLANITKIEIYNVNGKPVIKAA